ncbi:alpha/beta hydrolase [Myxococcota bacterium]|nr:alpha/beta hydrolase [Myxococcota bacterium]
MTIPRLAFQDVVGPTAPGTPEKTALVLHGILGSARNWAGFARRLAPRLPGWRLVLVDLRNHGDSHGQPPPHTLAACAADLVDLCAARGLEPEAVIGHSFGGKVALAYASGAGGAGERAPAGLRVCGVLDAVPGAVRPEALDGDTHEVVDVVAALREIPLPITSRAALQATLQARGFGPVFAGWMTTNLHAAPGGGLTWRFDLDAVGSMLEAYFETDFWPFLRAVPPSMVVHVVRAARSDRWRAADLAHFADVQPGGRVRLHVLPDAGHWVHVDNPAGLSDLLVDALTGGARPGDPSGDGGGLLA